MLRVRSAPGIKAPLLHKPKSYIAEACFVEVEDSHYYRSMINDGDLIEATDAEWTAQQDADAKVGAQFIAPDPDEAGAMNHAPTDKKTKTVKN